MNERLTIDGALVWKWFPFHCIPKRVPVSLYVRKYLSITILGDFERMSQKAIIVSFHLKASLSNFVLYLPYLAQSTLHICSKKGTLIKKNINYCWSLSMIMTKGNNKGFKGYFEIDCHILLRHCLYHHQHHHHHTWSSFSSQITERYNQNVKDT